MTGSGHETPAPPRPGDPLPGVVALVLCLLVAGLDANLWARSGLRPGADVITTQAGIFRRAATWQPTRPQWEQDKLFGAPPPPEAGPTPPRASPPPNQGQPPAPRQRPDPGSGALRKGTGPSAASPAAAGG